MGIKNILILGDSTSMTVGSNEQTFPFYLSNYDIWTKDSVIYNSSLHGFGSADALKFFKKNDLKNLEFIILNLGICDSIATEIPKKFNFFKKKFKNSNKIVFNNWNNNFDNSIHKPEKEEDFEKNIRLIIKLANNKKIKIILLIPDSNFFFQPGLAKGNFSYYNYYNLFDKSSDNLNFSNKQFKKAMELSENGQFKKSNDIYLQLLKNNISNDYNLEFYYTISNNFAVNDAYLGNFQKSLKALQILSREENIRKEIIFYNMSIIYKKMNDQERSDKFLFLSYNSDINNYRIKENFRNILKKLEPSTLHGVIDLRLIKNNNYYDHCHLSKNGHMELAEKIFKLLSDENTNNSKGAKIKNILYNPEYSLGNEKLFNNYFQIEPNININIQDQIEKITIQTHKDGFQNIVISNKVDDLLFNAIENYIKHPLFVDLGFLKNISNNRNYFYGKFPELFMISLCQQIYNFLKDNNLIDNIEIDDELFLNKDKRLNIFKNLNLHNDLDKTFNFEEINVKDYLIKVMNKINFYFQNISKSNQIFNRRKYTMYWFFRESVKFGTQSRISMFYNLIELQNIYEASVISIGLSKYVQFEDINYFINIKKKIEQLKILNEKFISNNHNSLKYFIGFDFEEYNSSIRKILN